MNSTATNASKTPDKLKLELHARSAPVKAVQGVLGVHREALVPKPMVSLAQAAADIDKEFSTDDVLAAIEEGHILWAWNIATRAAGRQEVRVLRVCVEDYAVKLGFRAAREFSEAEVLRLVLPDNKPAFECARLMRLWSAGNDLGMDLVREKSLATVPGSKWRRGHDGSALVTRESVIQFLKLRRIS